MRIILLLTFLVASTIGMGAQTRATPPAQPPPATAQPAPRAGGPAPPRRAPAASRGGMSITVTNRTGATLPGVHVEATGPTDRAGDSNASGRINLSGLLAGTYRLRFSGDAVITFEREVTLRAGQTLEVDASLSPAPEPPAPPPPPAPAPPPVQAQAPAPVGPKGRPLTLGIVDLLEKEFVGKEPRRESLLSCSGNERTTMVQLNEAMPQRLYENGDAVYYVLGGEGSVIIGGLNTRIATNGFVSVPRGTLHGFERRGNRPLVLLAVLSGEPCEQTK